MRIAILTERLKVGFGVDLVVHEQANRLARKHEVVVLPIELEDIILSKANYSVFKLNIPLYFNPFQQDYSSLKKFPIYDHLLSMFDVFIIQTPTFNPWIPLLKRYGKVIVYFHGNSPSDMYAFPKNLRKQIFDFTQNFFYYKFADKIITISKFMNNDLSENLRKKSVIIYHGSSHISQYKGYATKANLQEFKKKYFINEDEIILTYIGRLDYRNNPYKNTQELIEFNHYFKRKYKDKFRLIAIGFPENGIEREFFNNGISVIPKASTEDLICALTSSYLYISPSLWEGFNLPLIEAQSLGVPVIAYNIGAHPEVVEDKKSGFLVNNKDEFIQTIDNLIKNRSLREQASKNALVAAKNFTWDNNVDQLEKVL